MVAESGSAPLGPNFHADGGMNHQSPEFSILIAPAYDASVPAYQFSQFETHSLSR